jgi:hypothetical protein
MLEITFFVKPPVRAPRLILPKGGGFKPRTAVKVSSQKKGFAELLDVIGEWLLGR